MRRVFKPFTIFILTLIPLSGISDTIDFWEVYINDSLVAEFHDPKDAFMKIKSDNIRDTDKITIKYFQDAVCTDCFYELIVQDEQKRRLGETTTTEHFGELTFSLNSLMALGKDNNTEEFHFYFSQRSCTGKRANFELVLTLTLI